MLHYSFDVCNLNVVFFSISYKSLLPILITLKGFATFWEFSFYRQKVSLIMIITVLNLGLFAQT